MIKSSSELRYTTGEEVRIGDRVQLRRFLRKPIDAIVSYIPGITPKNPDLEYEDVQQWAISTTDGTIFPILYDPATFQPPKKIVLISRGVGVEIGPKQRLL